MSIIAVPKYSSLTLQCNINLQLQLLSTNSLPSCHKLTWKRKMGRPWFWAKRVTCSASLHRFSMGILKILQSSGQDQDCPMTLVWVYSFTICLRSFSAMRVYQTIIDTRISRPHSTWQSLLPLPSSCATVCCFGITATMLCWKGLFYGFLFTFIDLLLSYSYLKGNSIFQVAFWQGFFWAVHICQPLTFSWVPQCFLNINMHFLGI